MHNFTFINKNVSKKVFLISVFSFLICFQKIFSMGFSNQRSEFHQDFIDEITLTSWTSNSEINTDTFLSISHAFIDMMHDWTNNDFLWINNEKPNDNKIESAFYYTYSQVCERRRDKNFLEFDYFLNYIAKWILPNDKRVNFIGDIHGNFYSIRKILLDMKDSGFIDENMHLNKDGVLIFLGDYIDRGLDSLKVFTTAMLITVKNPGKVFLLKGNHEDVFDSCSLNRYGFKTEIEKIESDDFKRTSILNNLAKAFEFLPAALFIGYEENDKIKYQLCVHGGPDIRLKYCRFLQALFNDQSNYVLLKEISRDDFLDQELFIKIITDYLNSNGCEEISEMANKIFDQLDVTNHYNHSCSIIGFLWNDICYYGRSNKDLIKSSSRGDGLILIDYDFIKYFFNRINNCSFEVDGIVRGHEHGLPKHISQLEQGFSQIPYPFCTASVGTIFYYENSIRYKLLQYNVANCFNSNNFAVHTLISGCICGNFIINYNPTYLEMGYLRDDQWFFHSHECLFPQHQNTGRLDLDL